MFDKLFSKLQRVGQSFMIPIAVLPVAGLLMGIGRSFTNETMIQAYHLQFILGKGTPMNALFTVMSNAGNIVFDNLPVLFAVGIAMGMARHEKATAAFSALVAFFIMHASINSLLTINGIILDGKIADSVRLGTINTICGIQSLDIGVFGGMVVGLGVAFLHNKFYMTRLPDFLSFFAGTRFVPVICSFVFVFVGILFYYIWPPVQEAIYHLGVFVRDSSYAGIFVFGFVKRMLIPFGLHHVFYLPFWQTGLGGNMVVDGHLIQGAQNIFFAQLASPHVTQFNVEATRFFSGEYIFMMFGLPGAALAMYHCARPSHRKKTGGLLLSASLTSILTGITEPLEFTFLFQAPPLFLVHAILAGSAYAVAQALNIAIGLTFSAGAIDFFLFGILQGNSKTNWVFVPIIGFIYFLLYYTIFKYVIKRYDFKTIGRGEDTQLHTKKDYSQKKSLDVDSSVSHAIVEALGGVPNILDVDTCTTRLRATLKDLSLVDEEALKATGAAGIYMRGEGIQITYGPHVVIIVSEIKQILHEGE
ncbi:PTS transporter subunit EIIC [uncultured Catenibacterium sp.]|uniref:PTS transporter subunit EIIC n=1 Tax=uncultured Catenibacterium sp. TaxID=286142 RepID=UPI0025E7F7D3|nr:PTS transporter subunit EIIC [uncultured Catenibacterium sp.]